MRNWHSPMQLSPGTSDRMNHKVFMWGKNQVDTANRSKEEIYLSAVGRLPANAEVGHHFGDRPFSRARLRPSMMSR